MRLMNDFLRSFHCESGNCVEVSVNGDKIVVRNSLRPGITVEFTPEEWTAFIKGVLGGQFRTP